MKKRKLFLMTFALMMLVLMALILFYCHEPIVIPEELYGYWTTSDPKYEDRYFEISRDIIIFGLGENGIAVNIVMEITGKREDDRIIYTVEFKDDDGVEYSQSLYFAQNDYNSLMFKNQRGTVWHKQTRPR